MGNGTWQRRGLRRKEREKRWVLRRGYGGGGAEQQG